MLTNISHQLFDYKITFVNSQGDNTNSKGGFVLKNRFETIVLRLLVYKINLRFGMTNSIRSIYG